MSELLRGIAPPSLIDRIRWLIRNPPEGSVILEFDPITAKQVLSDYNQHNRPRKPVQIGQYSAHMREDFWLLTGDTIKFSNKRRLLDGQNRLMACVRADTAFSTHVVFGIDDDVFSMLDRNKVRSGMDVLAVAGFNNTAALAGALRWVHLIKSGRVRQRDSFEPREILQFATELYPGVNAFINAARVIYDCTQQPPSLVAALLYLFHERNPTLATELAQAWAKGEVGGRWKPLGLLRQETAAIAARSSGRVHDVVRAAMIILAWNMLAEKRKGAATELRWKLADHFPEIGS